jgi:PmbA protein
MLGNPPALFDLARRRGARAAELLVTAEDGVETSVFRGKSGDVHRTSTTRARLRVWLDDGRCGDGEHSDQGTQLVDAAMSAAVLARPGSPAALTERTSYPTGLGIEDRRYDAITDSDRHEALIIAERAVRATDRRVRSDGFRYHDRRVRRWYANTRGAWGDETRTLFSAIGAAIIEDEQPIRVEDGLSSVSFATIASFPFGGALATRTANLVGKNTPFDDASLLLPGRVVAALVHATASTLTQRDRGSAAPIETLSPQLSLIDDGTMPGGLGTRRFDDRGVVPIPLTLIREGKISAVYCAPDDPGARRATGHMWHGRLCPTNLVLKPGARTPAAVLADAKGSVFHVDHATHIEFDGGRWRARLHGVRFAGGRRVAVVRDAPFDAAIHTLLSTVGEICSDVERYCAVEVPSVLFHAPLR